MTGRGGRTLRRGERGGRQGLASREPELLVDQIEAGDQLGDAVLHLEPGIDFEEVECPIGRSEELAGRRIPEARRGRDPDGLTSAASRRSAIVSPGAGASSTSF